MVASRERASLADRVRRLGQENLRVRALLCIERDQVDSLRHHMALSQEEFRQIRRDRDDTRRRLRRLELLVERRLGFRRDGGNNENGNPNENGRGTMPVARIVHLTWWNSHKRIVGVDVAFAMTWRDLMKLMTESVLSKERDTENGT
ncbi:hypothetical protein Tco_0998382 [Tanacetum coccineum]